MSEQAQQVQQQFQPGDRVKFKSFAELEAEGYPVIREPYCKPFVRAEGEMTFPSKMAEDFGSSVYVVEKASTMRVTLELPPSSLLTQWSVSPYMLKRVSSKFSTHRVS
jgi:hypothetical protein